jgi:OST-HTH/LOTUS domain
LLLDTIDALAEERDQDEKIWGSMVKQALKRRNPGFNESYYGFRTFSDLLEEAQTRKLLSLEPDQKSGGYVIRRAARD